jgi:dUTP pyrophosphatase
MELKDIPSQLLNENAKLPVRKHVGDAGADLASSEDLILHAGERALVPTGVAIALPEEHLAYVVPRSGLAAKHGITIVNAPGLIDTGYRGEIKVCLLNTSDEDFTIHVGDRIAQLVVQSYVSTVFIQVDALDDTDRGQGGFGSTGTNQ